MTTTLTGDQSESMRTIRVEIDDGYLWDGVRLPTELLGHEGEPVASAVIRPTQPHRFTVLPGDYLVRIRLPSGAWLTQRAAVTHLDANLGFAIAHTEHEWLAKQELAGESDCRTAELAHKDLVLSWYRVWGSEPAIVVSPPSPAQDARDAVKFEVFVADRPSYFQVGGPRVPWRVFTMPPVGLVEIVVSARVGTNDSQAELIVSVMPRQWEAEWLLRYLALGAFQSARQIFEDSDLARGDRDQLDPVSAVACCYYLLRVGDLRRLAHVSISLDGADGWLPDAAIVRAWVLIRQAGAAAITEARGLFLAAASRGFPLFTEGVRLLVEGLRLLERPGDFQVAEARNTIGALACVVDWTRSTVTFLGSTSTEANVEPIFGFPDEVSTLALLKPAAIPARTIDVLGIVGRRTADIRLGVEICVRAHCDRGQPHRAVALLEGVASSAGEALATDFYHRALEIQPERRPALRALLEFAARRNDWKVVADFASRLAALEPMDWRFAADTALRHYNQELAIAIADRHSRRDPSGALRLYQAVVMMARGGREVDLIARCYLRMAGIETAEAEYGLAFRLMKMATAVVASTDKTGEIQEADFLAPMRDVVRLQRMRSLRPSASTSSGPPDTLALIMLDKLGETSLELGDRKYALLTYRELLRRAEAGYTSKASRRHIKRKIDQLEAENDDD